MPSVETLAVFFAGAALMLSESRTVRRIQDWLSGSALIGLGGNMALSARERTLIMREVPLPCMTR